MKIVKITVGTEPGEVVEETLVFSKDEPQPDSDEWVYDGYHYEKDTTVKATDGSVTWRRRPDRTVDATARKSQLYRSLDEKQETNPELTAKDVRSLAESLGAQMSAAEREKVVRQFLRDRFCHAIRFCETTGLVPKSGTTTTWSKHRKGGPWPAPTLRAAAMHMSQTSEASDMVSLALSEGALLRNGDRTVCSLVFGGADGHAKHICVLLVPKASVVTPQDVPLGGLERHRSTGETEVLFYGAGLDRYLVRLRDNPYTRADQEILQPQPAEEESSDEELPEQNTTILDLDALIANWSKVLTGFRDVRALFVDGRDYGEDWASVRDELVTLTRSDEVPTRLSLGTILRPIDRKISTLPAPAENAGEDIKAVQTKWQALLDRYRRS